MDCNCLTTARTERTRLASQLTSHASLAFHPAPPHAPHESRLTLIKETIQLEVDTLTVIELTIHLLNRDHTHVCDQLSFGDDWIKHVNAAEVTSRLQRCVRFDVDALISGIAFQTETFRTRTSSQLLSPLHSYSLRAPLFDIRSYAQQHSDRIPPAIYRSTPDSKTLNEFCLLPEEDH
ncbi:unnamed protein product [Colias eurytheme]|nr:unnamed protein product [Colias eurytheme]